MKRFTAFGRIAVCLLTCLLCLLGPAQANSTLTSNVRLKAAGITPRFFNLVSISPDNRYICGYSREAAKPGSKQYITTMFILSVAANGSIDKIRAFPMENVGRIEQACFTPDSKAVVFTVKAGATFMKLDCASGELTTIMEHVNGQPGFRSYPEIIINSNGEMIAQGYFYDANDFAGRNAIAVIDPNKTGVAAFTLANEVQKAQFSVREDNKFFTENFPRKDVGFMTVQGGGYCLFYRWLADKGVKSYDKGQEMLGAWGGGSRLLYTVKRGEHNYDLCVYDALTENLVTLSSGRHTPFMYVFLSADGKTALFNDTNEKSGVTTVYYAREGEGWKVKPVQGLAKKMAIGGQRISDDGTKMIMHGNDGIRVTDIK